MRMCKRIRETRKHLHSTFTPHYQFTFYNGSYFLIMNLYLLFENLDFLIMNIFFYYEFIFSQYQSTFPIMN